MDPGVKAKVKRSTVLVSPEGSCSYMYTYQKLEKLLLYVTITVGKVTVSDRRTDKQTRGRNKNNLPQLFDRY